jgi:hypothetical protein
MSKVTKNDLRRMHTPNGTTHRRYRRRVGRTESLFWPENGIERARRFAAPVKAAIISGPMTLANSYV